MKTKHYFNIAISIAVSAFLLSGCAQNAADKTASATSATVNSPIPTNDDAENEINYTEKLKTEGYSTKDIEASQAYVSRVMLQLNEIETFGSIYNQPVGIENGTDNASKYSELMAKIDEQKAVYYIVRLNESFNSLEDAFNEYLLALQADIEIDLYFKDLEKYNDAKNEKLSGTRPDDFITVRDIEEKALENLQNMNNSSKNPGNSLPGPNIPNNDLSPDFINPQPDIPSVEIPQPIDPAQQIREKLGPNY